MANVQTGELYTDEQYHKLTPEIKKNVVGLTQEESELLSNMNRAGRRSWLKKHKKLNKLPS